MAEPRKPDIKKSILNRVRMLYILFFAVGVAIAGKILYIQYGPGGESLRSKGERISYERVAIEADRGDVLAWDGRLLATSVPMYEVRMDFAAQGLADSVFRKYADSLAGALATFFGDKSKNAYLILLNRAYSNKSKNRFTQIAPRRVNHLEIKQISQFPILRLGQNRGGFIPVQINKRLLPNGPMASRTIGRVNEAGRKWGVEGAFDSVLRGTDGNMLMQRISGSFKIPVPDALSVAPVDGIDVVTTLDIDVQDVAENALRKQLELGDADWGTAVLMEVSTGEIRAITNLTRKGEGKFVEDFNYAVGMNLEPGSTFKLASLMTLLDDVLFIEDPRRKGFFHPRIAAQSTYMYCTLAPQRRDTFDRLHDDFFYRRHNRFWQESALRKLPVLLSATRMLACGEDLGMIPDSVPETMRALQILSLEIQRMPKSLGEVFADPARYPYFSVCTTSTHDMNPLRAWWEENRELSERFYREVLSMEGDAPRTCEPWICRRIVDMHLRSPAMLAILPLQDWLATDAALRSPHADRERINIPAAPRYYWRYRMHLTLEELLRQEPFNATLREMIIAGGRR